MNISDIKIGKRVRKDIGDLDELCRSIEEVGLLQPVVVTADNELVAGQRRVEAFRKLGRESIPHVVAHNLTEALLLLKSERDENTCRKDFTPGEAVALGEELEKLERPKAKVRKAQAKGKPRGTKAVSCGKLPQENSTPDENKTRHKVAVGVGMKAKTYEKAKAVVAAAKKAPKVFAPVVAKMNETGNVDAAYRAVKEHAKEQRRDENRQKVQATQSPTAVLGEGRFATIAIDPPWDWGDEGDFDQMGRAKPDYATMPFDELLKLPVAQFADDDCHLYLWITNRSLPKGFQLLEAWGFRYVTCLTWCKPSFGMGNYFRGQTEHILFGVKGSQPLKRKDAGTWFQAERGPDGHSSKPDAFFELVESCSPGPYLEIFSRRSRGDWKAWGADSQ